VHSSRPTYFADKVIANNSSSKDLVKISNYLAQEPESSSPRIHTTAARGSYSETDE
jgi:hypothetical protein